jgi:hypothetical protein
VSEECIHGFVDGMCASCNPKPAPEVVVPARSAPRVRAAAPARTTARTSKVATRPPANLASSTSVLEQRIYHVTNIRNLPGILAAGAVQAEATPVVELSPAQQRADRAEVTVDDVAGTTLDAYVAFFLTPDATLWQALRAGSRHPRLSAAALVADTSEYIFLISTVRVLVDAKRDFVVADGNAEGRATRFATTRDDADRMLYRLRTSAAADTLLEAELLVQDSLPFEDVTLIGVQNDKVRAAVRDVLATADFTPKISVYPPWFQVAE